LIHFDYVREQLRVARADLESFVRGRARFQSKSKCLIIFFVTLKNLYSTPLHNKQKYIRANKTVFFNHRDRYNLCMWSWSFGRTEVKGVWGKHPGAWRFSWFLV